MRIKIKISDDIPLEIQMEILKKLPVKSLIKLRSASQTLKSLIDSSDFILNYSCQDSEMQHLLVSNIVSGRYKRNYVSIIDDDTFPQQKVYLTPPHLVNMLENIKIIGSSHGLLCLYGSVRRDLTHKTDIAVIWNVSIRKSVAVVVPNAGYTTVLGFGICEKNNDSKIVKIDKSCINRQFKVFALSTGTWRPPYGNLPRKSIQFNLAFLQVTISGCPYWLATDEITVNGELKLYKLIILFDMTSEEFRYVKLPDGIPDYLPVNKLMLSKIKETLIVLEHSVYPNDPVFHVWMMEDAVLNSFTKLFTFNVGIPYAIVRGFRKSGESIIEIREDSRWFYRLVVFEPCSKQFDYLGLDGKKCSFLVRHYKESLLLHDHQNLKVYN